MSTSDLKIQMFRMVDSLPEKQLSELYQFVVDFVNRKKEPVQPKKKERRFGCLKGTSFYMADDFDEPLEDFKDYM